MNTFWPNLLLCFKMSMTQRFSRLMLYPPADHHTFAGPFRLFFKCSSVQIMRVTLPAHRGKGYISFADIWGKYELPPKQDSLESHHATNKPQLCICSSHLEESVMYSGTSTSSLYPPPHHNCIFQAQGDNSTIWLPKKERGSITLHLLIFLMDHDSESVPDPLGHK